MWHGGSLKAMVSIHNTDGVKSSFLPYLKKHFYQQFSFTGINTDLITAILALDVLFVDLNHIYNNFHGWISVNLFTKKAGWNLCGSKINAEWLEKKPKQKQFSLYFLTLFAWLLNWFNCGFFLFVCFKEVLFPGATLQQV